MLFSLHYVGGVFFKEKNSYTTLCTGAFLRFSLHDVGESDSEGKKCYLLNVMGHFFCRKKNPKCHFGHFKNVHFQEICSKC